ADFTCSVHCKRMAKYHFTKSSQYFFCDVEKCYEFIVGTGVMDDHQLAQMGKPDGVSFSSS
ncbi:hypothetical protein L0244_27160, partial [bacterium]|nr:hypothetical protein [bacterium]